MYRTGLLLLTQPVGAALKQAIQVLNHVTSRVTTTLYVQMMPKFDGESGHYIPCNSHTIELVTKYYTEMDRQCATSNNQVACDMRFILSNVSNHKSLSRRDLPSHTLRDVIQVVYVDQNTYNLDQLKTFVFNTYLCGNYADKQKDVIFTSLPLLEDGQNEEGLRSTENKEEKMYNSVCLGGTFDRLHTGHMILLSESCLRTEQVLTVGVTDHNMLNKKVLSELILPTETRVQGVQELLADIAPHLEHRVVPISDPYGPSITDRDIQAIVVSQETVRGGRACNDKRAERDMSALAVHTIQLVEDICHSQYEEEKISSSSQRKRLLGTLLKQPQRSSLSLPSRVYIMGLTGGIASGKSSVSKRLQGLGAHIIDCDKLGHQAYVKGTLAYDKVVQTFGPDVVGSDGEIDRKVLGPKVFSSKDEMAKLNAIVWPAIADLAKQQIDKIISETKGQCVIVLDAAVLLEAGWEAMTHEVWVTLVPQDEAVRRIMERNHLPEEAARERVNAQLSPHDRVTHAHVTLCTLWEYEYTQQQVEKAWKLLQERLPIE